MSEQRSIIRATYDGTTIEFDLAMVGARQAMAIRSATGTPWSGWLETFGDLGTADIDSIAVLLYVGRLLNGETVTFDEVAEGLTYLSAVEFEFVEDDDAPGEDSAGS
ncbi:MAG: hypothetical protein GY929_09665 [Actinomycetia bacterium]|nr:hypothetical protein [Actinomycetes bacterium]